MKRKEFLNLVGVAGSASLLTGIPSCKEKQLPSEKAEMDGPTEISYEKITLQLKHQWTITRGSAGTKENVFVHYKKGGITGIGEASHMTGSGQNADRTISELEQLVPLYQSVPPFDFFGLQEKMEEIVPGLSPAKCALDTALFDWIGKYLNIPVHRYLGINPAESVPTSFSIGLDTTEIMQKKAEEAKQFSILKIKLANKEDEVIINALRKATDKPLRVDINEGWMDKEAAIRKIDWLAKQGVELVEQPMPVEMLEETAWIRERSPLPIIADEAVNTSKDIPPLAEAYDGINIKLAKSGGIFEAYRMIILAQALHMKVMIGCMIESSVAIAAAVQLQSQAEWLDLDGNLLVSNDPFQGPVFKNGRWYVSNKPGIGIERI